MSQVLEAEEAAMASLTCPRLRQQKKKLGVALNFHQPVHPCTVRTGAELLVSGKGAGGGSLFPSLGARFPCFSCLYVFWPDRFVLSKLSVPHRLCGSRRLAQ